MTEKLYYQEPFLYTFEAEIVDITVYHGKPALVLDRTAFFPEGGGQPGDEGCIDDVSVFDTRIENDIIYHIAERTEGFTAGQRVRCEVNGKKRFARMQAHSGEHVVSGIAHWLFGVENVGFHMDDTMMTVDFLVFLNARMIRKPQTRCSTPLGPGFGKRDFTIFVDR